VFYVYWFLGALPLMFGAITLLDGVFEAIWFDRRRRDGTRAKFLIPTEVSHPFKRLGAKLGVRFGVDERLAVAGTEVVIGLCLICVGLFVLAVSLPG
jgi:uncharacterized membrane protein HdeD (DUF308 family)